MMIRCWGARGSIPVSGAEYLKYGGDTTCIEIRTRQDDVVIIDAGSGIRRLGNRLLAEKRDEVHMLFTHAHWDHLLGFPFFKPIYRPGMQINMYGCPFAQESVADMISKSMDPPYFPIKFEDVRASIAVHGFGCKPFSLLSLQVTPILLSHPNLGVGFRIEEDGKSFVLLTDNELDYQHEGGLDFAGYVAAAAGADLLFHDAEYTPREYEQRTRTWGHTTYDRALDLALAADVKQFGLVHHNQDRPDTDVDRMVADCRRRIVELGHDLTCFAVAAQAEYEL